MDSTKNTPLFGLDPDKPVVLVVDDSPDVAATWSAASGLINGTQSIIVDSIAGKMMPNGTYQPGALDILFHPKLHVAALITDNNFPMVAGEGPRSTTRLVKNPNNENEVDEDHPKNTPDVRAEVSEGAAGIMLLRLVKGGAIHLESNGSKEELGSAPIVRELLAKQDQGELKSFIQERFADMPVVWNTGNFTNAKVYSIEEAAKGKLLDAKDPRLHNESGYEEHSLVMSDLNTYITGKPIKVFESITFLKDHVPDRLTRIAQQSGKKPDAQEVSVEGMEIQSEPERATETKRE